MELAKGQVYKHYKGNFYKIIAVTIGFKSSQNTGMLLVRDESTLEPLVLYYNGDFCWLETMEGELIREQKVVYKNTQKAEHPWARSIESFTGKNKNNELRFTLVNLESATY